MYRIFYDHEFFCPRQDHIQVSQIFFKGHRTKIDENRDHNPPKPLFWGERSDAVPSDFSGNVVGWM